MSPSPSRTLEHEQAFLLLPWYVNASLTAEEHAQVDAHLTRCAACREERRWLSGLSEAVGQHASEDALHAGLARLWQRIGPDDAPRPAPVVGWRGRLTRLRRLWRRWRHAGMGVEQTADGRRPALRVAWGLAGAFGVFCVLGLAWMGRPGTPGPAPGASHMPSYRMLSSSVAASASASAAPAARAQIAVVFEAGVGPHALADVLRRVDARVLAGPGPEGAYVLDVAAARRDEVLAALQRLPSVRFAQPAEGTALAQP